MCTLHIRRLNTLVGWACAGAPTAHGRQIWVMWPSENPVHRQFSDRPGGVAVRVDNLVSAFVCWDGSSTAAALLPSPGERETGSSTFSAFCRDLVSGGTRIRTGDTMIFGHIPRPLGMRKTRIGKRISVHGVPLDTSWFCSYCCATVDTAFVTRALAQPLGVLRRGHKQRSRVVCADAGQGHQVGCHPRDQPVELDVELLSERTVAASHRAERSTPLQHEVD
jgi:hypothetical protein